MKHIVTLLFFGFVVVVGYRYASEKNISVATHVDKGIHWIMDQLEGYTEHPEKETSQQNITKPVPVQEVKETREPEVHRYSGSHHQAMEKEASRPEHQTTVTTHSISTGRTSTPNTHAQPVETVSKPGRSSTGKAQFNSPEWIKGVTRDHSPNSWFLLQQYDVLPMHLSADGSGDNTISSNKNTDTYHYMKYGSLDRILSSMATNVHEIAHGYFSLNSYIHANKSNMPLHWEHAEGFIYVSPSESFFVSVPNRLLFPSRKLATSIPRHLRSFRYSTYIEGNTSTQSSGIVGLLNELHAYYLGSKFNFDMLEVYRSYSHSPAEGFVLWVRNSQSEMSAFYEFDYYILEYLRYMKTNHPAKYREFIAYNDFTIAYKAVRYAYAALFTTYMASINNTLETFKDNKDYKVWKEKEIVWCLKQGNTTYSGTRICSDAVEILKPVINGTRYIDIKKDLGISQ